MIGQPVRRREDAGFLAGRGRYVADLPLEPALHLAVVRSPHAHARIVRVETDAARRRDGVVGVFTLADLSELRGAIPPPVVPAAAVKPYRQSALADGVVRFAGEAVAVVVATDPYRAADGAEAVRVAYEPLTAVIDPERAVEPDVPRVHVEWDTNVAASVSLEKGDVDAAIRRADRVVTCRFRCGRLTALPMEPRAVAARWDPVIGTIHAWSSTQMPYGVRQRTLMEYGLPRAGSVPGIDVASYDSPSPGNPLGVKGAGEGSAVPGPAAIANAVADALGQDAPELTEIPLRAAALAFKVGAR